MPSYEKRKVVFQDLEYENHPEYEIRETRVSDYLRKYGTGHIEDLPTSSAPEITDKRTVDQMLDEPEPHMSTESVDILIEIEKNKDRFAAAAADLELTLAQKKDFDDAVAALNDPNTPNERRIEAYRVLSDLEKKGKIARARK